MKQRTYWHLEALGRRPTDYEIATSRLLYYVGRGFEVTLPRIEKTSRKNGKSERSV